MTTDVVNSLRGEGWALEEGDLGENLLVSGVPYGFFSVGKTFMIGSVAV
jgi:MOSC domain-containing protein YiiM